MLFTNLITLASLAGTTLSNPVAAPEDTNNSTLARRGKPNVYRCAGENWLGGCYVIADPTDCHNRKLGLGSFGPDRGLSCTMYQYKDCAGGLNAQLAYPGNGRLWDWEAQRGFKVNSWRCRRT